MYVVVIPRNVIVITLNVLAVITRNVVVSICLIVVITIVYCCEKHKHNAQLRLRSQYLDNLLFALCLQLKLRNVSESWQ